MSLYHPSQTISSYQILDIDIPCPLDTPAPSLAKFIQEEVGFYGSLLASCVSAQSPVTSHMHSGPGKMSQRRFRLVGYVQEPGMNHMGMPWTSIMSEEEFVEEFTKESVEEFGDVEENILVLSGGELTPTATEQWGPSNFELMVKFNELFAECFRERALKREVGFDECVRKIMLAIPPGSKLRTMVPPGAMETPFWFEDRIDDDTLWFRG